MALQDLTPQLRTRLHRVEKVVTLFVVMAMLLLVAGFGYYLYNTAARKGWFIPKCRYFTLLMSAEGLKVGDPVGLMGFNVGEIVQIEAQPPESYYKIFVSFDIRRPYYGYIWSDSKLRIVSSLLGGRKIELLPGYDGKPTVVEREGRPYQMLDKGKLVPLSQVPKGVYVPAVEEMPLADRAQKLIGQVEQALPGVFQLTNQVNATLANVVQITSNVNHLLLQTRPILANAQVITGNLTNRSGSLGEWLIPTNLNARIDTALASANRTLESANATIGSANTVVTNLNAQLPVLLARLNQILGNVASISSNINEQVLSNESLLGNLNDLLIETEALLRGLKRHWLLKSAFPPPKSEPPPLLLEPNVTGGRP
ncbi:MAG: MlaD family protein [Verrucomicrobiae bacterium]|nr:MlaD family protein [Verrucomicrobiae bacterium]